jgi:hypothetical protein
MIDFFQYGGSVLSLLGAIIVSRNNYFSKWGFVIFAFSNLLLGAWAYDVSAWGVFGLNIAFMCINVYGILKWFKIGSFS